MLPDSASFLSSFWSLLFLPLMPKRKQLRTVRRAFWWISWTFMYFNQLYDSMKKRTNKSHLLCISKNCLTHLEKLELFSYFCFTHLFFFLSQDSIFFTSFLATLQRDAFLGPSLKVECIIGCLSFTLSSCKICSLETFFSRKWLFWE